MPLELPPAHHRRNWTQIRGNLDAARRLRAEWLVGIAQGLIEPTQLVQHAATPEGAALLRVRLLKLLLARPGKGPRDADAVIEALLREHPSPPCRRRS